VCTISTSDESKLNPNFAKRRKASPRQESGRKENQSTERGVFGGEKATHRKQDAGKGKNVIEKRIPNRRKGISHEPLIGAAPSSMNSSA